ncbi:MAG: hypothetical protein WA001_04525, partial [Patescibacteria group bacterium]
LILQVRVGCLETPTYHGSIQPVSSSISNAVLLSKHHSGQTPLFFLCSLLHTLPFVAFVVRSFGVRLIGECAQKCEMQLHFQSVPGLDHKEISVMTLARRVIDAGVEWLNRLRPLEAEPLLRQQASAAYHGA